MDEPLSQSEIGARRRRRTAYLATAGLVLAVTVYAVTQLGRATPAISGEGLWIDTVAEGDLVREQHGIGELVPDDDASRWVSAEVEGRVERKLLEPGAVVRSDTVLLQLSNPDVEQAAAAADLALDAAAAALSTLEATLQTELLALKSAVAAIESDRAQARCRHRSIRPSRPTVCCRRIRRSNRVCEWMRSPRASRWRPSAFSRPNGL